MKTKNLLLIGLMSLGFHVSFAQWGLTGNSGINPASNYLGTSDNNHLVFRTNNIERLRILNTGQMGVGVVPNGLSQLQIQGQHQNCLPYQACTIRDIVNIAKLNTANPDNTNSMGFSFIEYYNPIIPSGTYAVIRAPKLQLNTSYLYVDGGATFYNQVTIGWGINAPTGYKLYVGGGILTEKVKVALKNTGDWSDFVFAEDYKLPSLYEVESFIRKNKHLPNLPSAQALVDEGGIDVAKMDAMLLQKIEELTLYIIEQNKRIEALEKKVNSGN